MPFPHSIRRSGRSITRSVAGALVAALAAVAVVQAAPAVRDAVSGAPNATAAKVAKRNALSGFAIRGSLAEPLRPGHTVGVNLRVGSRKPKAIWVTRLKLSAKLDARSAGRGCSLARDYQLLQLPQRSMPIELQPQRRRNGRRAITRWTIQSDILTRGRPAIRMHDLRAVNQDACKGAVLTLSFTGRATNRRPNKTRAAGGTLPHHQPSQLGGAR